MKIILTCVSVLFSFYAMAQQSMYNKGTLYVSGNSSMCVAGDLENTGSAVLRNNGTLILKKNLANPGSFVSDSGLTNFNGNTLQQVSGNPQFYNLLINNTGTGIRLNNNISVTHALTMNDGDVDLNGSDLELGSLASIYEESNDKRIFGNSGVIRTTRALNAPSNLNVGGIGAVLTTLADLGSTTIERGHASQINGTEVSIQRYFNITPTNNAALDARLRFTYFDNELSGLVETDLNIWRSANAGATWSSFSLDSASSTTNYAVKSGIVSFSRWTLGAGEINPLPIELLVLSARCLNGIMQISWAVASETNNSHFTLEKSEDGTHYFNFATIDGAGNGAYREYLYTDDQNLPGQTLYYRLTQTDYNGAHKTFDPVSAQSCSYDNFVSQMHTYPNPFTDVVYIDMTTAAAGSAMINIYDNNSNLVKSLETACETGRNLFTMNLADLASGAYQVRIVQGTSLNNSTIIKH